MLLQNVGDMKTVGHLVHVQVLRSITTGQEQQSNVVNPQENTNWFVNVLMVMAGMEVILKLMDKNIARSLGMGMRKKRRQ